MKDITKCNGKLTIKIMSFGKLVEEKTFDEVSDKAISYYNNHLNNLENCFPVVFVDDEKLNIDEASRVLSRPSYLLGLKITQSFNRKFYEK